MTPLLFIDVARDETLARRAAGGDDRAFTALVARYQPRLERYCRSILRNDEDGSDAAQNTLTKALIALRTSGGPERAVSPWLFRIAHNESISLMRKRRDEMALDETVPLVGAGLHEQAELRADVAALLDGVAALPPRARHALLLREFAGLDHRAVGQVLGITPGAARQAVYEARASLKASRDASRPKRLVLGLPVVGSLWSWVSSLGSAGEVASGGAVLGGKIAAAAAVIATSAPVVVYHGAPSRSSTSEAGAAATAAPSSAKRRAVAAAAPSPTTTVPTATVAAAVAPAARRVTRTTSSTAAPEHAAARTRTASSGRDRRPSHADDRDPPAARDDEEGWGDAGGRGEDHEPWTASAPPARTRPAQASPAMAHWTGPQDSNPSMRRGGWRPQQPQAQPAPTPAPTTTAEPTPTPEPAPTTAEPTPEPQPTTTTPTPDPEPTPTE